MFIFLYRFLSIAANSKSEFIQAWISDSGPTNSAPTTSPLAPAKLLSRSPMTGTTTVLPVGLGLRIRVTVTFSRRRMIFFLLIEPKLDYAVTYIANNQVVTKETRNFPEIRKLMYLPDRQIYRFEDVEVDLSRNCLLLGGEEKHLRQKAFQVLVYLLERRERLVSKNELFETVWNNTAVTDDVLVQCVTEIRRSIGDDPHHPRFIKTVPKSGYRFIGSVEENWNGSFTEEITRVEFEFEDDTDTGRTTEKIITGESVPGTSGGLKPYNRYLIVGSAALLLAFTAVFYFGWRSNSQAADIRMRQIDGRKTVAVMFFDNQSNTAEFDWLREGLADMLVAGLSRSEKLSVLDRGQLHALLERFPSETDKIPFENAKEIARHTQAEFFITGSFARIGEHVRLDVQLHDAQTGSLQATETLTVERTEQLLTEIDLLSLKISNRLNAAPFENHDLASVITDNLEAYRYYSLAVEKAQALHNQEAIEMLEKAVALDPEFAMAHARIGYAYAVTWGQTEKGKPYLEKAFQLSGRLTEKDRLNIAAWYAIANLDFPQAINSYREIINRFPFETEAYWRLARLLAGEEKSDEAIEVLRQGVTIDAEAKDLYNQLGAILSVQGKHDEAIAAHERYVALAPAEPNAYDSLGLSFQWSGNYEKAIENYNHATELNPKFEIALVHLANTRFRLGQYREAIAAFRRYIEAAPSGRERARGYDCVAYIHMQKGELDAAERSAREAVRINEDSIWISYLISAKRGENGRSKMLEKPLLSSFLLAERGSRLNLRFEPYYRGMIALNNGKGDEAIEYFRKAISHAPPIWNLQDFEDCLANAYFTLGRFDEAIAEYERILQLAPNYPLARYHLAEAYQAKGMTEQARASYLAFLDVWKDADTDIPEIGIARKFTGS